MHICIRIYMYIRNTCIQYFTYYHMCSKIYNMKSGIYLLSSYYYSIIGGKFDYQIHNDNQLYVSNHN